MNTNLEKFSEKSCITFIPSGNDLRELIQTSHLTYQDTWRVRLTPKVTIHIQVMSGRARARILHLAFQFFLLYLSLSISIKVSFMNVLCV